MLLHYDCDGDRRRDWYLFLDDVAGVLWRWVKRLHWTGLMWRFLLEIGQVLDERILKRVAVSISKQPGFPFIPILARQDFAALDTDRHRQRSQELNESPFQRRFSALTCHAFLLC